MCFENVAWCEFCNFERHMTWSRCPEWRRTFMREVKYTGVFSSPPIPKPEDCPRSTRHVLIPIRPGSCPSGPPPAFVREERLRRRAYFRNFGYPDDTDEEDDEEDLPFSIRGSAVNGCVGYEVRARLMHGPEWRRKWTHRNLRARMGLQPCEMTIDPNPRPKPLVELPLPPSDLEILAEGEQPSRSRNRGLDDVVPRPKGIRWTHRLKYPAHSRQAFFDSDSDGASADTGSSVNFEAISLGTDSAPSPVLAPLSLQPQARRRRGVPVTGGRENIDLNNLLIPRLALPRQRIIPPMLGPETQPVEAEHSPDAETPTEEEDSAEEEAEEEEKPFQRPRSFSPRHYWGVPRGLMRRRYAEEEAAIIADIKAKGGVPFEPTYEPEPPAQPIPIRNPRKRTRKPLPKHDVSD